MSGGGKHLRIYGEGDGIAPKAIWHGAGNSPCRPVCSIWFPEFDSVVSAVGVLFCFFSCHMRPCAYLIHSVSFKVITRGLDFSFAHPVDSFAGAFLFIRWLAPFISSLELIPVLDIYFISGLFSSSSSLGEHNTDTWMGGGVEQMNEWRDGWAMGIFSDELSLTWHLFTVTTHQVPDTGTFIR